ncbi:hypothetical protein SEVIR_3G410900v4 [Setaria viridis]|uniref:Uncharacterized protein n=1 Tax=Setaria viridis TaxID=4556 RepID=A0A4U6VJ15_SETVI|nr:uncharacterized protein LOC117850526 isoform X1 [Setaria viridis]XP_034588260.1 uncharacterized protein LOC117850526 isoform X1 [Setaria viridis]TKW29660.1 hypothetical protein SEVIR_3G410900v2 [Setaria viridis]
MAAAPVNVSLQGPAGCPTTFLSARKPRSFVRFPRNHPLQQRGGVFPSLAWSAGGDDRRRRRLKAQEPDQVPRSCKQLFSDADFVDPRTPTSYIDVLNKLRLRHPSSLQQKLMREEDERYEKALQKCARNFVDGIIQFVSSEKEYYKFIIIACKENTNMIVELGFISCNNRDDILNGLERIEDDIAKGRFEWRENKDVRSNIVEALIERVGEPARKLDVTISQYVQKLTILRLWFHNSTDTILTQIEQLQVELVLLALRNWEFVVPLICRRTDWILLGEFILSQVELLESDVSRLRSCKNMIGSTLLITFPLSSIDGCLDSRLSDEGSDLLQNAIVNFANIIIGDIAINLATLERGISYWSSFRFLTSNDRVKESVSLLGKHVSDLDKYTATKENSLTSFHIQDPFQRFVAVYVIVQQILKVTTDFAKNASFNHEKVQNSPSNCCVRISRFSDFHTVKGRDPDQSEKKEDYAMVIKEFRSRSDDTVKRLIDWLGEHQMREKPLKFCKLGSE